MAKFNCITGKTYEVPEKSCLLCNHCTDIFVDYTHGPYLVICEIHTDTNYGIIGNCEDFIKEEIKDATGKI